MLLTKDNCRMPLVNNDLYLDLAKADFNKCQMIHQLEWLSIQKWVKSKNYFAQEEH